MMTMELTIFHMDNSKHEMTNTKELLILSLITVAGSDCKTEFCFEHYRLEIRTLILGCENGLSIVKR